jgi:predicted AAA+ superfamily ATPase
MQQNMKRQLNQSLIKWKNQPGRMPLLLRGARQVGKTFLIESFGKQMFTKMVSINFELKPIYKTCFQSLDPVSIVNRINLLAHTNIQPGETLLFLDEIQECPEALESLRYFKEQMPELHVIAAGSLLEFVLNAPDFSMPVGRIQSLYLKPLSFYEYLAALGKETWCEYLQNVTLKDGVDQILHQELLHSLKEYLLLGGMPAVISHYAQHKDYAFCQELQAAILDTYRNDFGKYAKQTDFKYLQILFTKTPGLVGQTIKYASISQDVQSRDLKRAIQLLTCAGILHPVYASHATLLPLNAGQNENKFKLVFLDVGLVQYTTRLAAEILLKEDILLLNRGSLAEQFVGQELLCHMPAYERGELFYWQREKSSSTAEIDYVTHVDSHIIPIEVKAGKTGRLKSLQVFLQEKNALLGVRFSQNPLHYERNILSIPLYMISEMERLVRFTA